MGKYLAETCCRRPVIGFFERLFGKWRQPPASAPEHAVIVYFQYGSTDLSELFALEDELERVIAAAQAGELDGNEVALDGSDARLYMYGRDADALFAAIRPTLEASPFMKGATVKLRYGPPEAGVRKSEVVLGT